MDDDAVTQFVAITNATAERAAQYLRLTESNMEQAIQLFFDTGGVDMGASMPSASSAAPTAGTSQSNAINVDDDEEMPLIGAQGDVEDDEAMARRLQEEMYGGQQRGGGAAAGDEFDEEGVRAPMARRHETLVGDDADFRDDPDALQHMVQDQLNRRQRRAMGVGRPGIFNQQTPSNAIWNEAAGDAEERRRHLARSTGGASEQSSKSSMLAEMFRPPFEIISNLRSWEGMRATGKDEEKWILVNVQDSNIFDCQVLNRDVWKNPQIQETVKENFIFKQWSKGDAGASDYIRLYFPAHESSDAYPHIAIVDPRTGEQVKVWSGVPAPKAMDFLMQLHEFLDRYSLKAFAKNPVATRKAETSKRKDVEKMTEEEMLQMAMQNSMGSGPGPKADDPDHLTQAEASSTKGKEKAATSDDVDTSGDGGAVAESDSRFAQISSSTPHEEPPATESNTTRIQFRHPGGRVIRRFYLSDPVRRIFEWIKASPLESKEGIEFDLIFMGKNIIEHLDSTIEEAGLKNGSVMVEFLES